MQIEIPDQTVRDVQAMLARTGGDVDVTSYVDRTLKRAVFFATAREIQQHNRSAEPDELERLVDEAVKSARANGR